MTPFQKRVLQECDELQKKLKALYEFQGTETFGNLPETEQARLRRQANIMFDYKRVLTERILAFEKSDG